MCVRVWIVKDDLFGLLSPYSFGEMPVKTQFADSILFGDNKKHNAWRAPQWMYDCLHRCFVPVSRCDLLVQKQQTDSVTHCLFSDNCFLSFTELMEMVESPLMSFLVQPTRVFR